MKVELYGILALPAPKDETEDEELERIRQELCKDLDIDVHFIVRIDEVEKGEGQHDQARTDRLH